MAAERVTVAGAGVIGLTCAVTLAEAGHEVDVLARELPLETTSAVAGALWTPYLADPPDLVARWATRSLEVFRALAGDPATGVTVRSGHFLGERPDWADDAPGVALTAETDPAPGWRRGWRAELPLIDMDRYLGYLTGRLEAAGGTLTRMALAALPGRGTVLNCTGLAARALAADPALHPVRGQVLRLTDPGLTEWFVGHDELGPVYVLPHGRFVVVGGTAEDGNYDPVPDAGTRERLLERAFALEPRLRGATVLSQRVGLRPARPAVRLEAVREAERLLVHCYGHGGSGVTLSWGCAGDVPALLARQPVG